MKRLFLSAATLLAAVTIMAETRTISSPDNRLVITLSDNGGLATYSVAYDGVQVMTPSRLGFDADFSDFTKGLKMGATKKLAQHVAVPFINAKGHQMNVVFHVENNSIAYRYEIPQVAFLSSPAARPTGCGKSMPKTRRASCGAGFFLYSMRMTAPAPGIRRMIRRPFRTRSWAFSGFMRKRMGRMMDLYICSDCIAIQT